MLGGRRIHLCVSGGIAAYKAVALARAFARAGATVRVAMTPNSQAFIGPLTFQAITGGRVLTATLDASDEMEIGHIAFAQDCDALVVAPATANVIGKAANGIGDEIVSTVLLAANGPTVVAPAMNSFMWSNPAVVRNVARLRERGWVVVPPDAGDLACGHVGPGRLPEPEAVVEAVVALLRPARLAGRHLVVSAGPTREYLDPVRFLGNPSTGKMGFAVAVAAARAGARVTLVHGPVSIPTPPGVTAQAVTSAQEMNDAVLNAAVDADAVVMAAAVADYRPAAPLGVKRKKTAGPLRLELERTPDILAALGAGRAGERPVLVGFAAETGHPVAEARAKRTRKAVDLIVANDVTAAGSGFGVDTNRVWLVGEAAVQDLPQLPKAEVAEHIIGWIADRLGGGEG
jgi:phosphopantothenoylcysteine decarboxylase / phosphopantothenate---cysteine ligase